MYSYIRFIVNWPKTVLLFFISITFFLLLGIPKVEFEIFEPKSEKEVIGGTVNRAKASCLCCGNVLPPDRVRAQLKINRGGADVTEIGLGANNHPASKSADCGA